MGAVNSRNAEQSVEWETLCFAALIYGGWFGMTLWHRWIPLFATPVFGGWIMAWRGSLQHETIHGQVI